MRIEVRLYATLRRCRPERPDGRLEIELPEGATVLEAAVFLGLDPGEIHLVMINGVGRDLNQPLRQDDRLGLFPPIGGG